MKHRLENAIQLTHLHGDPGSCYRQWRGALGAQQGLRVVEFVLNAYWLEQDTPL